MQRVEEASALNQPIRLALVRSGLPPTCPVSVHERLGHRLDAQDANQAHEKEHYDYDYEPATVASTPLTTCIAPPYFIYEMIMHPFPKPFIMRSMDKYSRDAKLDRLLR